jgi:hypothetical protein
MPPRTGEDSVNKTLEAWFRGYVWFYVIDRRTHVWQKFWRYNVANAALEALPRHHNVLFVGRHILKGFRGFYER